jgi:hypothetical protein
MDVLIIIQLFRFDAFSIHPLSVGENMKIALIPFKKERIPLAGKFLTKRHQLDRGLGSNPRLALKMQTWQPKQRKPF